MRKSIIFISAVTLLLVSCGGKATTDSMTPEEIVRQTLGSPNKACVDKYLPKTKSKMAEADKLKASGNEERSKKQCGPQGRKFNWGRPAGAAI